MQYQASGISEFMNSRQNCSPYIGLHREWWKWRTIWVKPHLWYLPQENHTVKGFWTVSGRYQVRYPWYCLYCKQCKASPSWDKLFSQTPQHHRHVFTSSPSSRFLNPPFTKKDGCQIWYWLFPSIYFRFNILLFIKEKVKHYKLLWSAIKKPIPIF